MKSFLLSVIYAASVMALLPVGARAQTDSPLNFLLPPVFRVTNELRDYIRSDNFPKVSRNREVELHHVDMIFEEGMKLSHNNIGTALLAISIAVLNRTYFEPTFPLIGKVRIPLPSEDSIAALRRIEKLPRYFFFDSPKGKWGDSAKLVHFFGSAYLTYLIGGSGFPDAFGVWIEEGEADFKLDSLGQNRDVFINRLGQRFGQALSDGRAVLPSDFLSSKYIRKGNDR